MAPWSLHRSVLIIPASATEIVILHDESESSPNWDCMIKTNSQLKSSISRPASSYFVPNLSMHPSTDPTYRAPRSFFHACFCALAAALFPNMNRDVLLSAPVVFDIEDSPPNNTTYEPQSPTSPDTIETTVPTLPIPGVLYDIKEESEVNSVTGTSKGCCGGRGARAVRVNVGEGEGDVGIPSINPRERARSPNPRCTEKSVSSGVNEVRRSVAPSELAGFDRKRKSRGERTRGRASRMNMHAVPQAHESESAFSEESKLGGSPSGSLNP